MAARDILTLNTDMASRLIRILYALALILITLAALAGVARGITRMIHIPQSRLNLAGGNNAMGPGHMAMNRPQPASPSAQAAADAPPSATAPAPSANVQPPAPQDGMGPRGMGMRDGMGRRGMMMGAYGMARPGMRGPGMGRGMMGRHRGGRFGGHRDRPGLLGHLPPVAQGGLMILRTLVMAAIGIMLARILAELAGAVLAMGVKARQA